MPQAPNVSWHQTSQFYNSSDESPKLCGLQNVAKSSEASQQMSLDSYENMGKSAIACDVEYVEDNNFLENDDIKMESYSEYDVLQYDGELIAVDDSCKSNDSISSHKENMKETSNTSDYLSHNFKSFPEEEPTSQMLSEVESSKQIPKKF